MPSNSSDGEAWIVQKFGGTSLGKSSVSIAEDIIRVSLSRSRIAVVCSARSTSSKAKGTTNLLLLAAQEAENPESKGHEAIVQAICDSHLEAAEACIRSKKLRDDVSQLIRDECHHLSILLKATQEIGEISSRSRDKIISKGEKLSCQLMTAILQDRGIIAQLIDLSDIIPRESSASPDQVFYGNIAASISQSIQTCGDVVPVITGYFGTVPGGLLDTVGRGYTDLCAALTAIGLGAKELQVWKEVNGIFTADPRRVPTATLLSTVSPAEAAELTFYGSEVIHPFTMEQVIQAQVPIRVMNVMNPHGEGTIIIPNDALGREDMTETKRPRRPTAVTTKRDILVISVCSNKRTLSHGFFANIFMILDRWRLSVDLISTSEVHVSMALHSESVSLCGAGDDALDVIGKDLQGAIHELEDYGKVEVKNHMAILSLVGKQMKLMRGIAGKMFSTLGEHNINIEMISQGGGEINISCVIEERGADRALNVLHTNLFTFLE